MKMVEGVDTFTLLHHDLNICTNSVSLHSYHINYTVVEYANVLREFIC